MQRNLKISKMELSKDGQTINVYTNIDEIYFKRTNIYEFKYQMWRIADIMDGLEERRFTNEHKELQYFYYHNLKPRCNPRFNIICVFNFRLDTDIKNRLVMTLKNLHTQSGSSVFEISILN